MGHLKELVLIFSRLFFISSHCLVALSNHKLHIEELGYIWYLTLPSYDGLVLQDGFLMATSLVGASQLSDCRKVSLEMQSCKTMCLVPEGNFWHRPYCSSPAISMKLSVNSGRRDVMERSAHPTQM